MAREMIHSGIEWIGEIPKEWNLAKYKYFAQSRMGETILSEDTTDEGIPIYSATQSSKIFGYIKSPKLRLKKGDFVIPARGNSIGCISIVKEEIATCTQTTICSCNIHNICNSYLFYTALGLKDYWFRYDGSAIPQITVSQVDNNYVLLPPLSEQQKIANYLDKVCGEVDEMIALQEQMIEELKAYKQSVITEAVTKGLNPDVPMKDSGIDWIGEIPEHWELEPIKYCFGRRSEKNNPVKTKERLSLSIDKGVTLYAEKTTNLDRFKDDFTQYQLAYPNDIVLNCMNMIVGAVGLSKYMGCVSPVYYVIYPIRPEIDALYYSYLLNISTIRGVYYSLGKGIYAIERGEGRVNTCRLKVSYDDFGRLDIPIPPIDEQKEITEFIQNKCAEIDALIAIKQAKIEELKDYKKSVIYEYVTGKKEVV